MIAMRALLAVIAFAAATAAFAQSPDVTWPKQAKAAYGTLSTL